MAMLQVPEDCNLWKDFPEGLHVLVVDRDTHALNEIKAKLEECKYEVTAFERSEDAVTALGNPSNSFHVALVEVAIGEGLEEDFSILKASKHNNIPIIMMSETENRDIVLRAFALGAVEFLQKPLSDEKLKNVWQHAVRKALSVGENALPKSLKSLKSIIQSPVNSSCTSNSDQIVGKEEILSEEKEDFGFLMEGKPNLGGQARGSERISASSTPQHQHVHILNSQVNADNFSGSSEATHKGEEAQPIQAEYSGGSSSSSCVDEAKKEHDCFTMESRMTSESASADELCGSINFNYCDKMEFDSASCFDDLCLGDGDLLSDLDIDPDIIAEFSLEDHGDLGIDLYSLDNCQILDKDLAEEEALLLAEVSKAEKEQLNANFTDAANSSPSSDIDVREEVLSDDKKTSVPESAKVASKNLQGKRKVKVDWTPDLHRRFVQAVEQFGIDKAVPSRILELMGVNCLTRHNIASHLQKYRSHRKHLLAREAEAASWNHRRQLYASGGARPRRELTPWITNGGNALIQPRPLMGFAPMPPAPHAHAHPPPFRPLHVWGHPTLEHSFVHMWQKQTLPAPSAAAAPATWPAADGSFWQQSTACKDTWGHNAPVPGTPCYPQPLVRLPLAPVAGVPHFTPPPVFNGDYYRPEDSSAIHPVHTDVTPHLKPASLHPPKETVDAAINEVLSNPWAPLPIGLKPPLLESVMTELQRQGISNVPPTSACLAR